MIITKFCNSFCYTTKKFTQPCNTCELVYSCTFSHAFAVNDFAISSRKFPFHFGFTENLLAFKIKSFKHKFLLKTLQWWFCKNLKFYLFTWMKLVFRYQELKPGIWNTSYLDRPEIFKSVEILNFFTLNLIL
jgi:hypothetical protein